MDFCYDKSMLHGLLQSYLVDNVARFVQKCGHQLLLLRSRRCHVFWTEWDVSVIVMDVLGIVYVHLQ